MRTTIVAFIIAALISIAMFFTASTGDVYLPDVTQSDGI